mgnify:CR=1 FL=1
MVAPTALPLRWGTQAQKMEDAHGGTSCSAADHLTYFGILILCHVTSRLLLILGADCTNASTISEG